MASVSEAIDGAVKPAAVQRLKAAAARAAARREIRNGNSILGGEAIADRIEPPV